MLPARSCNPTATIQLTGGRNGDPKLLADVEAGLSVRPLRVPELQHVRIERDYAAERVRSGRPQLDRQHRDQLVRL